MTTSISLHRDPALLSDPVSLPRIAGHPHLPCDRIASASPPHPAPGAASPTPTTPKPAANCGMPDRPLSPPSSSASSAPSAVSALPLADHCWDLFCQGHCHAAIGRTLGIHRETAARHIQAIHQQVQNDRRARTWPAILILPLLVLLIWLAWHTKRQEAQRAPPASATRA